MEKIFVGAVLIKANEYTVYNNSFSLLAFYLIYLNYLKKLYTLVIPFKRMFIFILLFFILNYFNNLSKS